MSMDPSDFANAASSAGSIFRRPGTARGQDGTSRAERRYEALVTRTQGSLNSWRTPRRRRLLVQLNWASLGIMAAIAIVGYFWFPIVIAWLPMTVVVIVAWTMLRTVVDAKDTAPARYLDEFETATLLHARSQALSMVTGILFVISIVLIFVSSYELGDGHRLAYAMGGLGILAFLAAAVIPASAMVRTMDPDEPAERDAP